MPKEERQFLEDKLRSAVWLLKSLDQRNQTIYRVTESILTFQRDFFDKGVNVLKPLNLKDIASELNLHVSTISRVTSNKYLSCPRGIYSFKYFFSNAPLSTPLAELVSISGMRWPIETIFEEAKGEIGMNHYEMRSWLGWHHHMLFVSLAHHFLVRLRIQFQDQAPALTIYQIRILLCSDLPSFVSDIQSALERVAYYQQRNFIAYRSHRKKKLAQFELFTRNLAL